MLECKDCCLYETDACRYGKYALEHNMSIQCDDFIVEHNKAYQQGRAEAIDECIEFIKEHTSEHYVDCDGYFSGELEPIFKVGDWLDDLEQLKEQR